MAEITDEMAVAALKRDVGGRAQEADTCATRTILHAKEVERKAGVKTIEILPYVIMGQYYPERKWIKAQDVEKRFAQLNKEYRASLKAKGLPTDMKPQANPLKTSPIEFK